MKIKVKHSIRTKLAFLLMCLTMGTFVVYLIVNRFFLGDYYLRTKEKSLLKGYEQIDAILEGDERITTDTANKIAGICEKYGITIIVVDTTDNIELQYGNGAILRERLQQINFGINQGNSSIIKKTENYILQSYNINTTGESGYFELAGFFNSNMIFLMRMAVESINESVSISMNFFARIGLVVSFIAIIIAFFISGGFTKPILKLAGISREMSNLNFKVKYKVDRDDEIGILGNSMNELSDKLENTILELKQANYELKSDIEKKEQIDEMRKDFISNVSHELKTPIALVQGYAEGLSECVNDDEASREFYCSVIMDEAEKMNKLVKNLLSLTQIEFGNSMLQYEKFDIAMVINGVTSSLDYMFKQYGVTLINKIEESSMVYADEFKIEEVLTNYITNAIHYSANDKKVILSEEKVGDVLRISVFNTGYPIPDDDIQHIWDKFYKVDKARTREYGGSGIGLSIVKAIMNAHGRNYGVTNHDDGVEFWFELDSELKK